MSTQQNNGSAAHAQLSATVIVVTLNRPDYVRRCLTCLLAQNPLPDQIIVVDASANTETREVAADFPGVLYLRNENGFGRMTASRNIGLQAAVGDIIAFVDDDAFAQPGWLVNLLAAYTAPSIGAVGGRVLGSQEREDVSAEEVGRLKSNGLLSGHFSVDSGKALSVDHIMGCNMSFRREVIAKLGGFREDYPGISGVCEDSDMSLRVTRAGYTILFQPASVVDHVGAPQAKGQRFDAVYTFFIHRNHMVMLIRNFGLAAPIVWRFSGYCLVKVAILGIKRVGAGILFIAAALYGMASGVWSGVRHLLSTGRDPVRHDPESEKIRLALQKENLSRGRLEPSFMSQVGKSKEQV